MSEECWTIYVTTPAGKTVEWDDWYGSLESLIININSHYGWTYLSHNIITMEVNCRVEYPF